MAILVTGANGYVGSSLIRQLLGRTSDPVVALDIVPEPTRLSGLHDRLTYIQADVGDLSVMLSTIMKHRIKEIYHLGAMLSSMSETQHWKSYETNVGGTMQLFELASSCGLKKLFFASSRGTFGRTPDRVIGDNSQQIPTHFYGWGKLYCEGVGRWYRDNKGLDFRCLRYPTVVGSGIRTAGHWAPAMIEDAISGNDHQSVYGNAGSVGFFLHVDDAARATLDLMEAPAGLVKSCVYNVSGLREPTTAAMLAQRLRERFPNIDIALAGQRDSTHEVAYDEFRDEGARAEWGWMPQFGTLDAIVDKFQADAS
ncbi:NAD-dependent epimerase/dehydratase family protein [Rhizobium lusitanum]|uniref:NAD-dependent epimerase/dehydratase family protein n=1 Tax=Rhizobium lusitanum TaxID=293958 RepID=A0A6L9UCU3_9HYPH|nr:NAD(P)-dependent oxidoreductase [Rhizobium lusitanum]NEI73149.1 NAD-dependent epimerase/dehydratase family protein [Rhizobium lusitanum]